MSYSYPPFPASDIWSYPVRKLTERFAVIERSRGYSSGLSKIYDEIRFINAILYLLGSGRGAIVIIPDDDIAYNKTWTVITAPNTGTAPTCVTDHNDSTNCSWSVGASAVTDLLSVDLGASMTGALRIVYRTNYTDLYVEVYVSNDNATWTKIYSVASGISIYDDFVYINNYRYIKISFNNTATVSHAGDIFSIEFYPDTTLSISRSFSSVSKRITVFVYGAYYQLLEVISL